MNESVRETREYDEARALCLRKAALRAEIQETSYAKKLRYFSAKAVTLAKTDVEQSMRDSPDEKPNSADAP
jgi:hypothetical protein